MRVPRAGVPDGGNWGEHSLISSWRYRGILWRLLWGMGSGRGKAEWGKHNQLVVFRLRWFSSSHGEWELVRKVYLPVCIEQRIIMKFLFCENVKPAEIYRRFRLVYLTLSSRTMPFHGHEWRFGAMNRGRGHVASQAYLHRPCTSMTNEDIARFFRSGGKSYCWISSIVGPLAQPTTAASWIKLGYSIDADDEIVPPVRCCSSTRLGPRRQMYRSRSW